MFGVCIYFKPFAFMLTSFAWKKIAQSLAYQQTRIYKSFTNFGVLRPMFSDGAVISPIYQKELNANEHSDLSNSIPIFVTVSMPIEMHA